MSLTKSNKQKIEIYDTTLRDGSQSEGISYSVQDKIRIAEKLDQLGIDYIEAGWPGSNPKDLEFFNIAQKMQFKHAKIVAFGSTRRANTAPADDTNLKALIAAGTKIITIFGKSWDLHVKAALKVSLDENLRMIEDSINYLCKKKKRVIYDAEHFFDGYKANPEYALKTIMTAIQAGAETVVLCDTNGGSMPSEISAITQTVAKHCTVRIGIHTHNDTGVAAANALAAVAEGATHVQGTINGLGERCGNSDLITIMANLQLKLGYKCLSSTQIKNLTETAHYVAEICNMIIPNNQAYVGRSAFAHKGGIHINAVMKHAATYEHVEPDSVGNHRRFLTSELSGKSNIIHKAEQLKYTITKDSPKAKLIHELIQKKENEGYQYEAAEASFDLLIHKTIKQALNFFELIDYKCVVVSREGGKMMSEATVRLNVKGVEEHTASLGDGPVNALDQALRKALIPFYPSLKTMHLSDFKVRVLDQKSGTAAKVRVFIESSDSEKSWTTVGISTNLIEASWQALVDAIEFKLWKK